MATIAPTVVVPDIFNQRCAVATWVGLTAANADGAPVPMAQFADRSVQVTGDFDGATLHLEGSNNGADWAILTDHTGAVLSFTSAGLRAIAPLAAYIRPLRTGGGASTNLNVTAILRG